MYRSSPRCVGVLLAALVTVWAAVGFGQQPEWVGRRIVAIEFLCAAPIDRQGLLQLLPLQVGEKLSADALAAAQRRLTQTELFSDVTLEPQARDGGCAVVVHLVRKSIIASIRFRGNHAIGDEDLRRAVRMREGVVLTDELRDFAVKRIRERYVAEGFDGVQARAVVRSVSPGEIDVTFRVEEGPPLRIAAVEVEGGGPVAEAEIRQATRLKPGDRHVRAQQRAAQTAIVRLFRGKHYYEADVDSRWEVGADHTGVVRFRIDPGPPFLVHFSGNHRFGDERLLRLMDLLERPIVTDGTWREVARRVQRLYQESGYYFARVDLHIEPGTPKVVRFDVHEDRRFRVAAVEFEGNHRLSTSRLRQQMATRPPSWILWRRGVFLDDVFDDDLKRLWFFYRQNGFETAEITDARTRFDPERGEVVATVFIEEGPRTIVRRVERSGFEAVAHSVPDLQVVVGEALNRDQVEADRRALLAALARAGFTQAEVRAEIVTIREEPDVGATVRFVGASGVEHRVGAIIVQNNFETRARVVTREVPDHPGDPVNPDALLRGQGGIYRLGIFRSVSVRPLEAPPGQDVNDIAVSVSEKPAGTVQWGAGYNTRDGFRGFAEIADNNLQGLARRLSLRGEFAFDPSAGQLNEYLGSLGFREPRLGDTLWTFRANLIAQRSTLSVNQFSLERFAFIPAIERTLLPGLQTGLELQAEQAQVFDVAADVLVFNPRDAGRLRTVSVGPFLVYDGRDDAFAPRRGIFDLLRLRYAPGALGSDVPFVKLLAQHSQYVPLLDGLTFVYAVRGGWAHVFESGEELPIRERFFLGGRTTVRGFGENEIGPRGSVFVDAQGRQSDGNHPLGGDLVVNLNAELRFPLLYGLGGAVFADGGGLYLQDRAIDLHDFRRSAGLGLQYVTPVGPISLDYGFKLDRRVDESVGEVHFSIGNIF